MRASFFLGFSGLVASVCIAACGTGSNSGGGDGKGGKSGTGGGGTSGSSAAGGAAGSAAAGAGGDGGTSGGNGGSGNAGGIGDGGLPDVVFNYDAGEQDGGFGDACAATTVKAEAAPLDMYIMLDNSGSMASPSVFAGDCNIGQTVNSKWCFAINALDKFFKAAPAGTGVALQYFPKCFNNDCGTGNGCSVAEVALGQLPANLTPLENSLNLNTPTGGTPTEAALRGIATYTKNNKQPNRAMIGVLITDGIPEACNTDGNFLKNIVTNHLNANGIKTFVIGMSGASYGTLNTIASGGGAPQHTLYCNSSVSPCYYYDVGQGDGNAFIAVLQTIQQLSVGCQYNVPQPAGGLPDPNKVEVLYSPGGTPPPQKLDKVNDATACTANGGWYYDNNANPKVIHLCPATCTVVTADQQAKVDINLGCLGS